MIFCKLNTIHFCLITLLEIIGQITIFKNYLLIKCNTAIYKTHYKLVFFALDIKHPSWSFNLLNDNKIKIIFHCNLQDKNPPKTGP